MKPSVRFLLIGLLFVCLVPLLAETYIVTTTADSGPGSFRQAILNAEAHPGSDLIVFNIPQSDPNYNSTNGVWTIQPLTALPSISTDSLEIQGGSQSQFIGSDINPFGPEIELDGSLIASSGNGLFISGAYVEIFELAVNRCADIGIIMEDVDGGRIAGCVIGMDPTGMSIAANHNGISLNRCRDVAICPAGADIPNLVSGNASCGIFLWESSHNSIQGNLIGLNRTGEEVFGNGYENYYGGISLFEQCDSNEVSFNTIGGNTGGGIYIYHSFGNQIFENSIGTGLNWSGVLANIGSGVMLYSDAGSPEATSGNVIRNNTIGYNTAYGILTMGPMTHGNPLIQNGIASNAYVGIWNTDSGFPDPPVILGVQGSDVVGTAGPGFLVEVFTDSGDQGQIFLGSNSADGDGHFSVTMAGPFLANFTATATDLDGNTSPFSDPLATAVDPKENVLAPIDFRLEQNFPNPFNPETRVVYAVKERTHVVLEVFDTLGRKAAVLVDEVREPGVYHADFVAEGLPSGVYVYRIRMTDFEAMKKMVLLE